MGNCQSTMATLLQATGVELEPYLCEHCCQIRSQQKEAQRVWQLPKFQSGRWQRLDLHHSSKAA
ncbi:hypothetical protein [Prochlorococcus marinus]